MSQVSPGKPPSFQEYVAAFQASDKLAGIYLQILKCHYYAYEQTITAKQLSQKLNYSHHAPVNGMYGRLAGWVSETLNYNPEPEKLGALVTFDKREGEWHWILRPEVSKALEVLEWVNCDNVETELKERRESVEIEGFFDVKNLEDARQKIATTIVKRQGQSNFRRQLLRAYSRQCAITNCDVEPALEAAHIVPYQGVITNHPANGLLLRADIHTLFDLHLISINPESYLVVISQSIMGSCYQGLLQKKLRLPKSQLEIPNHECLSKHYEDFLRDNMTAKLSDD